MLTMCAISATLATFASPSAGEPYLVLMPDVREPYDRVFREIVQGIESKFGADVHLVRMTANFDPSTLALSLKSNGEKTIIALGTEGMNAAIAARHDGPLLIGAVFDPMVAGTRTAAVSLMPDPKFLFQKLKRLSPGTRRIHVVYSASRSGWLVQRAIRIAAELELELSPILAEDVKAAAGAFQDIFKNGDPRRDAMWLLRDNTALPNGALFRFILERAWAGNWLVFSSSPAHVRHGALFAAYVDYYKMGQSLADLANRMNGPDLSLFAGNVLPVSDLQTAVNLRTAGHIGLAVPDAEYQIAYPAR